MLKYTVSQKNPRDYVFDDNLNSKRPIVIIFGTVIMRPSSLGGGRILRRTLSVRLSVCLSVSLSVRPSVRPSRYDCHR